MIVCEDTGVRFVEGPPALPLMYTLRDVSLVIESCFSNRAKFAILYASNMTRNFFDLSSGEAGEILQKLRTYKVRLALVCPPGTVKFSTKFPEMVDEEARHGWFRISNRQGLLGSGFEALD